MIKKCFLHSGNDLKSGKLSSGMGGRFVQEWVAGLGGNLQIGVSPLQVVKFNNMSY